MHADTHHVAHTEAIRTGPYGVSRATLFQSSGGLSLPLQTAFDALRLTEDEVYDSAAPPQTRTDTTDRHAAPPPTRTGPLQQHGVPAPVVLEEEQAEVQALKKVGRGAHA